MDKDTRDRIQEMRLLHLRRLRSELGFPFWHFTLQEPRQFATFSHERGVQAWGDIPLSLWRLGLLHADLVVTETEIPIEGLVAVGLDATEKTLLADCRRVVTPGGGWGGSLKIAPSLPPT